MRRILDLRTAKVAVELTNRCNFRCGMCPMNTLGRDTADMPWWLVEKVAAELRADAITVAWLHEMGEPLLFPRLAEAIDLFAGCSLSTNAALLDERVSRELLASSLGRIRLCLDTINPRLYPLLRRGGAFELIVANIRRFLELSRERKIRIEIQRLITPETRPETVRSFADFFRLDQYPRAVVVEKTCEPLDTSDETQFHQSFFGCLQGYPFRWFVVLADGSVTHCCYDAHGQQIIGDMKTQTVREIGESAKVKAFMTAFRAKDWRVLPRCGECYRHADGKPLFLDRLISLGHRIDRVIPIKPLARRLINR